MHFFPVAFFVHVAKRHKKMGTKTSIQADSAAPFELSLLVALGMRLLH